MNIELIQYDNVREDGVLEGGAVVPVSGLTSISPPDGGCGIDGCPCVRGHFFMKLFPRDGDGTVRGFFVEAADREELESLGPDALAGLAVQKMM